MKLFKYEGYNITISEEALTLKPFKEIWKRDKSKDKQVAINELSFIYFMEDPRSDYQVYIDRDERMSQIRQGEGIPDSWKPDNKVLSAMEFYASFKSEAALLAEDLRVAITNVRTYLKNINLNDTDDKGKPKHTLDSYTNTISKLTKLITELDEAEKTITKDIIASDKVRGSQVKGMYEDI